MEVNLNLAPNKHMLELNFDEGSSDEESQNIDSKQEKPKFQKVYDIDFDSLKRDKFTSNKVQKGLFTTESETFEYDTFEVQQKPQLQKPIKLKQTPGPKNEPKTQSNQSKTTLNMNQFKKTQKIHSLRFSQKSSSDQQKSKDESKEQSQQDSESQTKTPEKKQESDNLLKSKKKLLELDFSESSSEQQDQQQKSQKKSIDKKLKKKQREQEKNQEQSQQQQEDSESEPAAQKPQQKQILKDFFFTKEPQYQVLDQIRPQQRARAIISRCRSGFNLLWPEYSIKIESTDQQILYVKKQVMLLKSEYKIYCRSSTGNNRYFGKLSANMSGTEFQIYISENGVHENLKAEMYFPNDSKSNQPRYFIMVSLIDGHKISDLTVHDSNNATLKTLYQQECNRSKMMLLHTRKPIFHEHIRGFVLNFSGRVSMPSIKNFILEDVNTNKEVLMFGKIDKDNFRLQISSPLNCVIGTAVALIQFEGRFME